MAASGASDQACAASRRTMEEAILLEAEFAWGKQTKSIREQDHERTGRDVRMDADRELGGWPA